MKILGISGLYHNSAAAICDNGEIVVAAEEERFTRIKNDKSLPLNAIEYCMRSQQLQMEELDAIVYYDNPLLTLDRFLHNCIWVKEQKRDILERNFYSMFGEKMWIHKYVRECLGGLGKADKLLVTEHHISHAAQAFYLSPFQKAAILIVDGVGEWATTTIAYGDGKQITVLKQTEYPHSLGMLYSAFTYYCGFKVNSGEYKMMGLAPYGTPKYVDLIKEHLIQIKEDGTFVLNMKYFEYMNGHCMIGSAFEELFGCVRRKPEQPMTTFYCDVAASIQKVTEEIILHLVREAKKLTGCKHLCMGGGVALNCVANEQVRIQGGFEEVFIPPGSGDSGGAIGCALYAYYQYFDMPRVVERNKSLTYLGPDFSMEKEKEILRGLEAVYEELPMEQLYERIADLIADNKIVGLFQGKMEFGPRALGARSILANPMDCNMQYRLNMKIKYRESFRPFAPAVLEEYVSDYFETDKYSPYMLFTTQVKKDLCYPYDRAERFEDIINQTRSRIPAITHVDYSARIQTVNQRDNAYFYHVIDAFRRKTGCPIVINTSFNVRGEPIVCTPKDAYECFMATEMDVLVIDGLILYKEQQPLRNLRSRRFEDD